jgi:NhaA family Na+:H+ antiporter
MPLFALANAGVSLQGLDLDAHSSLVAGGIAAGLILGKPLGILAASAICLRLGIARLPAGIEYRHLLVLGVIAGIGFTMSLFVAQLAFADAQLLAAAKLAVLVGSATAGILGLGIGRLLLPSTVCPEAARSVGEAEASTAR